jgi:bifunctional non-homologous end joining protein LigD
VFLRLPLHPSLAPSASVHPPNGNDWCHEPKWDGFRFQVIKDAAGVRFYSRHGAEYTDKLPCMREAFARLPTESAILDGELALIDPRGAAHFYRLMAQMRTSEPDESQVGVPRFDLLYRGDVDLRDLPLLERKCDLSRLCRKSKVPCLKEVQTLPNGPVPFERCNKFGFEGVVSKRRRHAT